MTECEFTKLVGRPPEMDDLERVNCTQAGEDGHEFCGWNHRYNCPMFQRRHTKTLYLVTSDGKTGGLYETKDIADQMASILNKGHIKQYFVKEY